MTRWWVLLGLLCWGCDDGGEGTAPEDAEPKPDMLRMLADAAPVDMVVADAAVVDAALMEAGADGAVDDGGAPAAACSDGLDNDRDGVVDFPDDPGCESAEDDDEADPAPTPECDDGIDNDADGLFDVADPDCSSPTDPSESGANASTVCSNGADDDGDGLIDFPDDPGCPAAGHNSEADLVPPPACFNEADDDGDGQIDYPRDPGCAGAGDEDETTPDPPPACDNGVDDDGNGATDWPEDIGCDAAGDATEVSPCGAESPVIDLNAWLEDNPSYDGTLVDAPANLVAVCGGAAGGERVFVYTVDRELDRLAFSTRHPETEAPVVMYLRDRCDGEEQECVRGLGGDPGASIVVERPAEGRYFLVVDTGSRMEVGAFRLTVDAVRPPACRDGEDNDDDGRVDVADPGCAETEDPDEVDPEEPPVCANGIDDDMDGFTDWPDDVDCVAAGAPEEEPPCRLDAPSISVGQAGGDFPLERPAGAGVAAGRCEAGVGPETVMVLTLTEPSDVEFQVLTAAGQPAMVTLHARTDCPDIGTEIGCRQSARSAEPLTLRDLDRGTYFLFAEQGLIPAEGLIARVLVTSNITECNDQLDNDFDGLIDLEDIGCERGRDMSEADPPEPPQCSDGVDNDMNGVIDWPDDDGCAAAGDNEEEPPCQGRFWGEVCVVYLSEQCVRGSAAAICDMNGGETITLAEFRAVVAAGWVRPDAGYHTVAVTEYAMCPGGFGNVGIPGWGEFRHFNCEENSNYCNRAVMCVTR